MKNYEQKYKEALEVAKRNFEAIEAQGEGCTFSGESFKNTLIRCFPELKESEGEKIRKWLISHIEECRNISISGNNPEYTAYLENKVLAWLEKTGEKTNPYSGTSFEYNGHIWGMCARDNGVDILLDKQLFKHLDEKQRERVTDKIIERITTEKQKVLITETNGDAHIDWNCRNLQDVKLLLKYGLEYIDKQLKKQGGQKSADKVEPKYNVGDWVVCCDYEPEQIIGIRNNMYEMSNGDIRPVNMVNNNYNIRLWTIKEALDGDVLCIHSSESDFDCIFLYQNTYEIEPNRNVAVAYCCIYVNANRIEFGTQGPDCIDVGKVKPATKEQRDLLFTKMKEAGYKWDAEKKELKKIKQKTAWSDEDDKHLSIAIQYVFDHGYLSTADWLKSLPDRVQPQPKWSEEDEKMLDSFLHKLEVCDLLTNKEIRWIKNKFKSLPDRVQPQPKWSEEDKQRIESIIAALMGCITRLSNFGYNLETEDIITQLKDDITYFKSLNEKVQPQPKWSEKDENTMKQVIDSLETLKFYIEGNDEFDDEQIKSNFKELDDEIKWLQDIVPQPKQKLSEDIVNECVDLGLPSGTLWKPFNEEGYYTYDEAVEKFSSQLPSKEQWEELKDNCTWEWEGSNECRVIGPNGKSIYLPAAGCRRGTVMFYVGADGIYWSSTYRDESDAYGMYFGDDFYTVDKFRRNFGRSVRLVK